MALLEELKPGVLVKGLLPGNLVTVVIRINLSHERAWDQPGVDRYWAWCNGS